MLDPVWLAHLIRFARRAMDLSQRELAHWSGVPKSTIADIEAEHRQIGVTTLATVISTLGYQLPPPPLGPMTHPICLTYRPALSTSKTLKPLADASRRQANPSSLSHRCKESAPKCRLTTKNARPAKVSRGSQLMSSSRSAGFPMRIGGFDQISSNPISSGTWWGKQGRSRSATPNASAFSAVSCSARSLISTPHTVAAGE
jgi:DNA-binding XRE family transcriptional regulator